MCFYDLLFQTNKFILGAVFLSCLLSEIQKSSLLGIKFVTVLRGCDFCFCNLFLDLNNFVSFVLGFRGTEKSLGRNRTEHISGVLNHLTN